MLYTNELFMKKLKTSVLFLIFSGAIHAQETTLSVGNDASGPGGTVNYSVGQIVYTTHSGTNGSSAQGVQQPFEIMTVAGIDIKEIQLELSAYPNPATHALTLKIENYALENLTFQLTDLAGKMISSGDIKTLLTQIPVDHLPAASYFLTVRNEGQLIKNFKIIKN